MSKELPLINREENTVVELRHEVVLEVESIEYIIESWFRHNAKLPNSVKVDIGWTGVQSPTVHISAFERKLLLGGADGIQR